MTEGRRMMMWAGAAFGVVYLILMFVAGLVTGNAAAWKLATFTTGMAYFATVANVYEGSGGKIAFGLYLVILA